MGGRCVAACLVDRAHAHQVDGDVGDSAHTRQRHEGVEGACGGDVPELLDDANGGVSLRIIDPLSISLGTLVAKDHATNAITPFKIARITGVTTA